MKIPMFATLIDTRIVFLTVSFSNHFPIVYTINFEVKVKNIIVHRKWIQWPEKPENRFTINIHIEFNCILTRARSNWCHGSGLRLKVVSKLNLLSQNILLTMFRFPIAVLRNLKCFMKKVSSRIWNTLKIQNYHRWFHRGGVEDEEIPWDGKLEGWRSNCSEILVRIYFYPFVKWESRLKNGSSSPHKTEVQIKSGNGSISTTTCKG